MSLCLLHSILTLTQSTFQWHPTFSLIWDSHYVGAISRLVNRNLQGFNFLFWYWLVELAASLLGVEAEQDASADTRDRPFRLTVTNFTDSISQHRNRRGIRGMKDEGLRVSRQFGAENRTT
ncbi:hypothetical protein QQP08_000361, partial [Theobroma cacao]